MVACLSLASILGRLLGGGASLRCCPVRLGVSRFPPPPLPLPLPFCTRGVSSHSSRSAVALAASVVAGCVVSIVAPPSWGLWGLAAVAVAVVAVVVVTVVVV